MRAILTYHSLDDSRSPISVSPRVFGEQLRWFASGAVRVVPLGRIGESETDRPVVAITFDDGFTNLRDPLTRLTDQGLPATVFVVTGHVGGTNAWGGRDTVGIPTLPLLSWHELGRLSEGGVEMGAHTESHPRLPDLPSGDVDRELAQPIETMTKELGQRPTSFAYPYGRMSPEVVRKVGDCYRLGCTTELRALDPTDDSRRLPRLDMYYWRESGDLERFGGAGFRARVWGRRQARRARDLLGWGR